MNSATEVFIKGSDNQIVVQLTEDGVGISGAWTSLTVYIGDALTITRSANGSGVDLDSATGDLTITPGQLTENLSALIEGQLYPVWVKVASSANPNGVDFGAGDSTSRLYFLIQERPA